MAAPGPSAPSLPLPPVGLDEPRASRLSGAAQGRAVRGPDGLGRRGHSEQSQAWSSRVPGQVFLAPVGAEPRRRAEGSLRAHMWGAGRADGAVRRPQSQELGLGRGPRAGRLGPNRTTAFTAPAFAEGRGESGRVRSMDSCEGRYRRQATTVIFTKEPPE